jgi:hypothetical protein
MKNIDEIFEQFNSLKHPSMNAPQDDRLSDLRQSFELDVDSVAGFLSYEANGKKSPYAEQVLELPNTFKRALADVREHVPLGDDNISYKNEVIYFLEELIKISEKLEQYINNEKDRS